MEDLAKIKSQLASHIASLRGILNVLGESENGSWSNRLESQFSDFDVNPEEASFSGAEFFIPENRINLDELAISMNWDDESKETWQERFNEAKERRGSLLYSYVIPWQEDFRHELFKQVTRKLKFLQKKQRELSESDKAELDLSHVGPEVSHNTDGPTLRRRGSSPFQALLSGGEDSSSDESDEELLAFHEHEERESFGEEEDNVSDLRVLHKKLTELSEQSKLTLNPHKKEEVIEEFNKSRDDFNRLCISLMSSGFEFELEGLNEIKALQESVLELDERLQRDNQAQRVQSSEEENLAGRFESEELSSDSDAGEGLSDEALSDEEDKGLKKTEVDLAQYLESGGILQTYLRQRANTFAWRDFFSSYFAFFVGRCWSYKTEQEKREQYINTQLEPSIREAMVNGEKISDLKKCLHEGIRQFKPRCMSDGPEYHLSLQYYLTKLYISLGSNSNEAKEELHDQHVMPYPSSS